MKVAIFGATGFAGQPILKQLLVKGHQVTALVRNPQKLTIQHQNLTIIKGDVFDKEAVTEVIKNQDAVIQSLGINGKGTGKPTTFFSDATKVIIETMESQNVNRLICLSNVGARESMNFQPWIFRKVILPYFMNWLKVIIDDKNRMEPIIQNSDIDSIIVRCPNIIDKPAKGKINATTTGENLKLSITNPDLANFIEQQLTDNTFLNQAVCVSN